MSKYSLGIIDIIGDATEREVKINYRIIEWMYHPYEHRPASNSMSPNQSGEFLNWLTMRANFYAWMCNVQDMKGEKGKHRLNSFNTSDDYDYLLLLLLFIT